MQILRFYLGTAQRQSKDSYIMFSFKCPLPGIRYIFYFAAGNYFEMCTSEKICQDDIFQSESTGNCAPQKGSICKYKTL